MVPILGFPVVSSLLLSESALQAHLFVTRRYDSRGRRVAPSVLSVTAAIDIRHIAILALFWRIYTLRCNEMKSILWTKNNLWAKKEVKDEASKRDKEKERVVYFFLDVFLAIVSSPTKIPFWL